MLPSILLPHEALLSLKMAVELSSADRPLRFNMEKTLQFSVAFGCVQSYPTVPFIVAIVVDDASSCP